MTPKFIETKKFGDSRGWFSETYSAARLQALGITDDFVQDNHSYSAAPNTIRGIHFQSPTSAQAKLVRCLRGEIWDVIVDLRAGSPTFGDWRGVLLSEANGYQLYVPIGFGHGFQTLVPDCEVVYKVSAFYDPLADGGIAWNDPTIGIEWKSIPSEPIVSEKDRAMPPLSHWQSPFLYNGEPFNDFPLQMG